jgi:hypothetical protein
MLNWLFKSARRAFPEGGFVAFVTAVEAPKQVIPEKPYVSNIASTRLRVLIPARQLARRVPVWLVSLTELVKRPDLAHLGRAGAIVLGKLTTKDIVANKLLLAELLRRLGDSAHTIYADLSDDYAALGRQIGEPFLAEYQKGLGRLCSFIVPCAALSRSLAEDAKRGLTVIEDPYESASPRPVRVAASSPLGLAWFGNLGSVNQAELEQAFGGIASGLADTAIRLEVVAADAVREHVTAMAERLRQRHPRLELGFTPWSLAATEAAIARSDYVLLPQDHRSAWAAVKSHNRLVAAIRAGRLAVASPIPAYQELAGHAWVGEDLAEGLRWAIAHPDEAAARVTEGQRYVESRFAPEVVGAKWAAALGIG